jgi:rhodanese-related sulfurtransferase
LHFKHVSPEQLDRLTSEGPVRLVDVRTDMEVGRGVIEGAYHVPLHLLPVRMSDFGPHEVLVFYCQSGARSAQACGFLASHGFHKLYNLQGGILGWARAGRPLAVPA